MTLRCAFAMSLLALLGCAGTASGPVAGFHGNTFAEPRRGIHATLPPGWVFVSPDRVSAIQDSGVEILEERNPEMARAAAHSAMRTRIFFLMANASRVGEEPESIALMAETLPSSLLGMTTETYAMALRNNLRSVDADAGGNSPASIEVSGLRFQSIHAVVDGGSGLRYQSYYVRLQGNEVLTFLATHQHRERGDALIDIIQSLEVRP